MSTKTPKLRFPEFSEDWILKTLGDVAYKIQSGRDKNSKAGKYPLYGSTGVIGLCENYSYSGRSILIARVGANAGLISLVNYNFGVTDNTLVVELKKDNIEFAFYLLTKQNLNKLTFGSGQPLITGGQLKLMQISIPTLSEQTKIANLLTTVDEKIQALKEKKSLFEDYKKGLMQKIFSQEIRFKQDDGSNFDDWEEKRLGEICEFYRGSPISKSDLAKEGEFQCIHYGELFTKYNEVIKTVISKTNKENGFLSQKGDILMPSSDVTPKGLAKASSIQIKNVVLGGDMNILRPNKSYSSIYLSYLLNFNTNKIIEIVSGTTVKHIYNKDVRNLEFVISNSFPEQQKIANFLTSIDEKIEKLGQQIEEAQTFKKGLLQQMFV